MSHLSFRNGDKICQVGLGTWKSEDSDVKKAVKHALESGYTHIDCAATYGNEAAVGEAIQEVIDSSSLTREDLFITSKLWNNAHRQNDVLPALQNTLADLKLDYLDLYLMHWPVAFKSSLEGFPQSDDDFLSLDEVPLAETWNAMLETKQKGLIKHAGVSNFSVNKLKQLIQDTSEVPEMNQIELHPYLHQDDMLEFCQQKEILITAYSPLGSQDRTPEMKADNEPSLLENNVVKSIAKKHKASAAQVLINFHVSRGCITIPKSVTPSRINENLNALNLKLDQDDLSELKTLDKHYRYVNGKFFETSDGKYHNIYDE